MQGNTSVLAVAAEQKDSFVLPIAAEQRTTLRCSHVAIDPRCHHADPMHVNVMVRVPVVYTLNGALA
jgi:hypothetical protein